jgi:tetratricopeptide (TPR) repeat protein
MIFLMNYEQIFDEALRLTEAGDNASALPLWEKLRNGPCNTEEKIVFLLYERQCLSELANYELAESRLQMVEALDSSCEFLLSVENARIDDLYRQKKGDEAIQRGRLLLQAHAKELATPELAGLAYKVKQGLGCGLINAGKFEEGLQIVSEILPTAESLEQRRLRYFCALAYQNMNHNEEAIAELKLLLESDEPDQWTAEAHYDLGILYQHRNALAWAKYHLQKAEMLKSLFNGSLRQLYEGLSYVCESLREFDDAKRYASLAQSATE